MRSMDDKGGYNHTLPQETHGSSNPHNFEFHKASKPSQNRKIVGGSRFKPAPSKWDDAQKWLAGLSSGGGDHGHNKNKPRNSNADDRRLLNSASQKERESCSSADLGLEEYMSAGIGITAVQEEGETKKIDCGESGWRMSKPLEESALEINSVCLRDVGTEMTPMASQEPSRTGTPIRATTPVLRSPIESRTSSPGRYHQGAQSNESYQTCVKHPERSEPVDYGRASGNAWPTRREGDADGCKVVESRCSDKAKNPTALESRAMAWDEAERAKYIARYKREEVKIQAWENHEKRKAEMEMKRIEVKAERLKIRAQEKMANKLASTRRIAEEKRSNAEAKMNERAAKTAEKADYIRRTGHLPRSFSISFKLPSICG